MRGAASRLSTLFREAVIRLPAPAPRPVRTRLPDVRPEQVDAEGTAPKVEAICVPFEVKQVPEQTGRPARAIRGAMAHGSSSKCPRRLDAG